MDKREAARLILLRAAILYGDIMPPEWANDLNMDHIEDIVVNYGDAYLTEEERALLNINQEAL